MTTGFESEWTTGDLFTGWTWLTVGGPGQNIMTEITVSDHFKTERNNKIVSNKIRTNR